jgi:stearoyl-CoA desaturase (delta-9 desaturase)
MLGALRIKTAITLLLLGVELSYVYAFVTPPVSAISKKFTSFATPAPAAAAEVGLPRVADISYSEQYDAIFGDSGRGIAGAAEGKALPKPSPHAQSLQPGAKRIPFSTVYGVKKRPWFLGRSWGPQDRAYGVFFPSLHLACLAFAPRTFSPGMLGLAFAMYVICGCLGITMTYHRMLAHRAFRVPKWLEYIVAYCGAWAVQGDPVTWCSDHRYHHTSTDTPLDPHSPYEGFWHSRKYIFCLLSLLLHANIIPRRYGLDV